MEKQKVAGDDDSAHYVWRLKVEATLPGGLMLAVELLGLAAVCHEGKSAPGFDS